MDYKSAPLGSQRGASNEGVGGARSQTAPPGDGSPGDNRMLPYVPPELRLVISHRFTVRKLVRPIRPGTPNA